MTHREQFAEMVKYYMEKHRLFDMGWDYDYDRAKKRLGLCKYGPKLLTFSLPFIDINTIDVMRNTVLHEVSHALAGYKAGHGYVWQRKAIEIGAKPQACASDPNIKRPPGPYVFNCLCGPQYYYRRDALYTVRICRKCRTRTQVVETPV